MRRGRGLDQPVIMVVAAVDEAVGSGDVVKPASSAATAVEIG
jgi:hypothetical protein